MPLEPKDVRHIALLARLALTPEEETMFADQLGHIFESFEKLDALDVTDVEPTSSVVDVDVAFVDDGVTNPPSPEVLRSNAPAVDGSHFRVPKIIE